MAKDKEGHGSLNEKTPTLAYRLLQRTMMDVLVKELGKERVDAFSRAVGFLVGGEFARRSLDLKADFRTFAVSLQKVLMDLKVGTLRIESFNPDTGNLVITAEEKFDCNGLLESIYIYEEGFVAGILEAYTGKRSDGWNG